jgi:hypothetical protein
MNSHPEYLGRRRVQLRSWAGEQDTIADQVRKMRKLGAQKPGNIDPFPMRLDQQVM